MCCHFDAVDVIKPPIFGTGTNLVVSG